MDWLGNFIAMLLFIVPVVGLAALTTETHQKNKSLQRRLDTPPPPPPKPKPLTPYELADLAEMEEVALKAETKKLRAQARRDLANAELEATREYIRWSNEQAGTVPGNAARPIKPTAAARSRRS